ncbi:iron-containing alcohol dehydrogenase [Thermotoga profunda]|uniref:iron-containing alcohol dehydrogenase n=1 Tax=Thermotoga profunda TaxID=1508420 RepID=UPI000597D041|nr:iron-containing alcohol dehydrogenase [Thermotoga profunda]
MIDFLGKTIECSCGKLHEVPNIEIICEDSVSQRLSEFFEDAFFLADENTISLVRSLEGKTIKLRDPQRVTATMENVQKIRSFLKNKDCREIVSVGSGSLTDIAKYTAYLTDREFSAFPTAPSVDGYTSSVAPLIVRGVKKTLTAKVPRKIIIDPEVIVNSPIDLIRAGIGDISSKIIARLDWILSNLLTNEYICDFVWDDMKGLLKVVLTDTRKILQRDRSSILNLMKIQLISGLNITIIGNSRPASGAEHLISHVIEMYQEHRGQLPLFHGLQVAMGTYITMKAYEAFFQDIHFAKSHISLEDKEKLLIDFFGEKVTSELQKIYLHKRKIEKVDIKSIQKILEPIYLQYHSILEASLFDMGVGELFSKYDKNFIKNVIIISTTIRDRYTILDLFDQLGILKDFCDWFMEHMTEVKE